MAKTSIILGTLFFCLFNHSGYASLAELIERDWEGAAAGNGYITFDSRTGIEWLDVNLSTSLSYADQLALVNPGGTYEGFRFATISELESLHTTAFGQISKQPGDDTFHNEVIGLLALIGRTDIGRLGFQTDFQYAAGRLAEASTIFADTQHAGYIRDEHSATSDTAYFLPPSNTFLPSNSADLDIGAFLVRVPEPSPILGFALCFGVFWGWSKTSR